MQNYAAPGSLDIYYFDWISKYVHCQSISNLIFFFLSIGIKDSIIRFTISHASYYVCRDRGCHILSYEKTPLTSQILSIPGKCGFFNSIYCLSLIQKHQLDLFRSNDCNKVKAALSPTKILVQINYHNEMVESSRYSSLIYYGGKEKLIKFEILEFRNYIFIINQLVFTHYYSTNTTFTVKDVNPMKISVSWLDTEGH